MNATDPDTNAWARHERGELDTAGFTDAFEAEARAAGFRVDAARVLEALQHPALRPAMGAAVRRLRAAVAEDRNVFGELMAAARVCTLGQVTDAFFEVGGQYRRNV